MQRFNSWLEMLEKTNYCDNSKYLDMYIYPNTGSINVDFKILIQTISILNFCGTNSIDDYFYYLNFVKSIFINNGIDYLDSILPSVVDYSILDTDNFQIFGGLGALVVGYSLLVSKDHFLSMSAMGTERKDEYVKTLFGMRELYQKIWHKKPIVFEYGTNILSMPKANSVDHAHTHIVNHNYINEDMILQKLNFIEVNSISEMLEYGQDKNYISYISPTDKYYITTLMQDESQIMRKFIAIDIGKENEWDWRYYPHLENSFETAKQLYLGIKKV